MDSVLTEVAGGVGRVTLNRPSAMNAITTELAVGLESAVRRLAGHARVIVIRGAAGNFSVGGDFKELERLRADGEAATRELFASFGAACAAVGEVPVPVIAAVEGFAVAGGFELMMACDIALVHEEARIADIHSNFGQVPGGGSTQRLPRLVGTQRALGLILSGDRLSGPQAVEWGLAYQSFDAASYEEGVSAFAESLAGKEAIALARSKRLVRDGLELPLAEGLSLELRTVLEHLGDERTGMGIARFTSASRSEQEAGR